MVKIEPKELRAIQLNILDHFTKFCKENNINFWLTGGTLLGAVRHKGFIPWDDDIDLGMLRKDYDKLIWLYDNNVSQYKFYTVENNKEYCYQMGKVFDDNTILYELGRENGYKIAVYIDIFVYDNAPDDEICIKKMFDKRDKLKHIRTLQTATIHDGNIVRQVLVSAICKVLKLIPSRLLVEKIVENAKKCSDDDKPRIGDFLGDFRVTMDKDWVENLVELEFEGRRLKAPSAYHEWLTLDYGDYMELPPLNKRLAHHNFEAYYKEN